MPAHVTSNLVEFYKDFSTQHNRNIPKTNWVGLRSTTKGAGIESKGQAEVFV